MSLPLRLVRAASVRPIKELKEWRLFQRYVTRGLSVTLAGLVESMRCIHLNILFVNIKTNVRLFVCLSVCWSGSQSVGRSDERLNNLWRK